MKIKNLGRTGVEGRWKLWIFAVLLMRALYATVSWQGKTSQHWKKVMNEDKFKNHLCRTEIEAHVGLRNL